MKKIVYVVVICALLVPVYSLTAANDVSLTTSMNITLTNPSMALTVGSGSSFSSMTVTVSTVAFTISAGGSITLNSVDAYTLTNDQAADIICPGASQASSVTYSVAAGLADSTITFSPTANRCYGSSGSTSGGSVSSGGGGGGGGTAAPATPAPSIPATESTGKGASTINVGANAAGDFGVINSGGKNALMGEAATATFSLTKATGAAAGTHNFKVQNITGNQATITISSSQVVFTLISGSSKNVDVDGDGYRDVAVTLNRIVDGKADVTTKEIEVVKIKDTAPGSLVKIKSKTAVYYLGPDSKRYVFPNAQNYFTWFSDFSKVKTISDEDMAKLPIGALVTYRPGTRMVKFLTNPDVYAVTQGGVLRKLKDEAMAEQLYGKNWNKFIDDVNDAFYSSYSFGSALATSAEYNLETQKLYSPTITDDRSL